MPEQRIVPVDFTIAHRILDRIVRRGSLPTGRLSVGGGSVSIAFGLWYRPEQTIERQAAYMAAFPGGRMHYEGATQRGSGRARRWYDRTRYSVEIDGAYLDVEGLAPHEHGRYGYTLHSGESRWRCDSCKQYVTKTHARAVGLVE